EQPALATWLGCVQDEAVGYFELEVQTHHNVQIAYFGLRPEHVGRGLGGALLAAALEQAWSIEGTRRVWLHTCSHDHPHALRNYQARGLTIYRTVHRRI
ncbi:MAG: GNAT family N-acetyltransferase, partial [Phycisphaerae bacterium]|nr:GNAT family N-acetyltransferase [Phycisphaerae bacterium]